MPAALFRLSNFAQTIAALSAHTIICCRRKSLSQGLLMLSCFTKYHFLKWWGIWKGLKVSIYITNNYHFCPIYHSSFVDSRLSFIPYLQRRILPLERRKLHKIFEDIHSTAQYVETRDAAMYVKDSKYGPSFCGSSSAPGQFARRNSYVFGCQKEHETWVSIKRQRGLVSRGSTLFFCYLGFSQSCVRKQIGLAHVQKGFIFYHWSLSLQAADWLLMPSWSNEMEMATKKHLLLYFCNGDFLPVLLSRADS